MKNQRKVIKPDEEYTPKEFAGFVKRSVRAVYTLIRNKRVPVFELNGRFTIKGAEILKIMSARPAQDDDA